jgi:hypothetical protein
MVFEIPGELDEAVRLVDGRGPSVRWTPKIV